MDKKAIKPLSLIDQAAIDRAMDRLKITKNALANVVCWYVVNLGSDSDIAKRAARISLAADKGYHNLLHRRIERR